MVDGMPAHRSVISLIGSRTMAPRTTTHAAFSTR
jgi:hypothetical protein